MSALIAGLARLRLLSSGKVANAVPTDSKTAETAGKEKRIGLSNFCIRPLLAHNCDRHAAEPYGGVYGFSPSLFSAAAAAESLASLFSAWR